MKNSGFSVGGFFKAFLITSGTILILFVVSFSVAGIFLGRPMRSGTGATHVVAAPHMSIVQMHLLLHLNHPHIQWDQIFENLDEDRPVLEDFAWHRRDNFYTMVVYGLDNHRNTDVLMIVSYCVDSGQAHILSIPRDVRSVAQRNNQRINSAYSLGVMRGGHETGIEQLKDELGAILGFRPDFYVGITHAGFIQMIDALGGVEVRVPMRMFYDEPGTDMVIDLHPGLQLLDGATALHFARYRTGSEFSPAISDTTRMNNQHLIIRAALDELRSPRTILRLPELVRIYRANVNTDLTLTQMLWFAGQIVSGFESLDSHVYPTTSVQVPRWYAIPTADAALELINATVNPFTRDIVPSMLNLSQ